MTDLPVTKADDKLLELLRTKCGGCEGICEEAADEIDRLRDQSFKYLQEVGKQAMRADAAESQLQAMRKALNEIAPAVESLACHQEQCDEDGIMIVVSRQAVDEVTNAINEMAIGPLRSLTEGAEK